MAQKQISKRRQPGKYPSIADNESKPGSYNEPASSTKVDVIPSTTFRLSPRESKADLRLRIEQLLMRRCSLGADDWAALGDPGRAILVELIDDPAIRSHETVFHRLIAVIGELAVKGSVAPLAALLNAGSETNLTKAYAATALGHIGESSAIDALASALTAKDDMVRRQVAKALGRLDSVAVIPHLRRLQSDKSIAVSEVAAEALGRWEKKLGQHIGATKKPAKPKALRKKVHAYCRVLKTPSLSLSMLLSSLGTIIARKAEHATEVIVRLAKGC